VKPNPTSRAPKPARNKTRRGRASSTRAARETDSDRCRRYLQAITLALGVLSSAVNRGAPMSSAPEAK